MTDLPLGSFAHFLGQLGLQLLNLIIETHQLLLWT